MAKPPPKTKRDDDAPAQAPLRQRSQDVQGPPGQPTPRPAPSPAAVRAVPRPVFGRPGDAQVPQPAQQVITALQQTVRSQAVLIRNYQDLLRLQGMDEPESSPETDGTDDADAGEAA